MTRRILTRTVGRSHTRRAVAAALIGTVCVSVLACSPGEPIAGDESASAGPTAQAEPPPRLTLIATPLTEPAWSPEVRARLEEDLTIARAVMEVAPDREDSYIWLGRRLGYLARFPEAVEVFTRGLEKFPDSYKLFRYRGRHLARSRDFENAIADYRRAADLIAGQPDTFEPDGILNSIEQPITTYTSNIHYYLGQTSMAVGDYETVVTAMERALNEPMGQSADRLVSTAYWRYLGYRKLGQDASAQAVVDAVPDDLQLIENFTYYDSVRFFKGTRTREELLPEADNLIKFAIAMDHHFRGEQEIAEEMWRDLVVNTAQGYWPAEAELVMAGATAP